MVKKPDYKLIVLEYLIKHSNENISRDYLIEQTKISKSRLSEVINSIKNDGYDIITPPRSGIVRLKTTDEQNVLAPISDTDIRQWIILFLLSKYKELSFKELLIKILTLRDNSFEQMKYLIDSGTDTKRYDNASIIKSIRKNAQNIGVYADENGNINVAQNIVSVTALRKDLKQLRELGLVEMNSSTRTSYRLTSTAPYIIPISADSLYEFCMKYKDTASSISEIEPLKQAYHKMKLLINLDDTLESFHRFGKSNSLSHSQQEKFNTFIQSQYTTHLIQIEYDDKKDTFAVGLLFYSVETGGLYALGKNLDNNKIESRRIDWFKNVSTLPIENSDYHADIYFKIYNEMFSSSYEDEVFKVKILFQDFGNVGKRFTDLAKIRENAKIYAVKNKPDDCPYDYIYEDSLRGLTDFARYLRSFGRSVLALEPPKLVDDYMLFTYNRIVEKYGELNE
ncbi:Predicted DNA-binding transcriptional regulator YafY, contains an HTH and WYL domains [Lachnospiraceae bacterium XBB1006]|nr:Predicted DNA-binding transcriptional regulator YafY, contains an HTH and WYL domains [Lachnospiraceae bacterium XBB1006]